MNASATPIAVTLQVAPGAEGGVDATLTFTNRSPRPYYLLKWRTFPSGRIDSKEFEVTVNGEPALYTGILKKRGEPTAEDWGLLQPGYQVTSTVSLSQAYEMPPGSDVSVTYDSINPPYGDRTTGDRMRSNTVRFIR